MSGEGRAPRDTDAPAAPFSPSAAGLAAGASAVPGFIAGMKRGQRVLEAAALWRQLVSFQPGVAAALVAQIRALPQDWPLRLFDVGRQDAAIALPPDAEPEETALPIDVAPVNEFEAVARCEACSAQEVGDCRWHRGYAAGVMALYRAVVEALKAQPRLPDTAMLEWLDVAATTVGIGEPMPEPPAAAETADRAEPTPCSDPPCNHDDGHPCDTHGTEQAHARGDHQWCGITCQAQFSTEALRNGILWRAAPGSTAMLDELLRRAGAAQSAAEPAPSPAPARAEAHPPRTEWLPETRTEPRGAWYRATYPRPTREAAEAYIAYERAARIEPGRAEYRVVEATTAYRVADPAPQQPAAEAPYPPSVTWVVQTHLRGVWKPWSSEDDDRDAVLEDFERSVAQDGGRHRFRVVRSNITYAVEAEHVPQQVGTDETAADSESAAECPAGRLPLGSAPVERCVARGPHAGHVTAAGERWTDAADDQDGAQ